MRKRTKKNTTYAFTATVGGTLDLTDYVGIVQATLDGKEVTQLTIEELEINDRKMLIEYKPDNTNIAPAVYKLEIGITDNEDNYWGTSLEFEIEPTTLKF